MTRISAGILAVAFLLLRVSNASSQSYSSGITAPYRVVTNVPYLKTGAWEGRLDVYSRTDTGGPYPTVIWIHGGDSMAGAKENSTFSLLPYMEWGRGMVCVDNGTGAPYCRLGSAMSRNRAGEHRGGRELVWRG